jgi:hypothetical protein
MKKIGTQNEIKEKTVIDHKKVSMLMRYWSIIWIHTKQIDKSQDNKLPTGTNTIELNNHTKGM